MTLAKVIEELGRVGLTEYPSPRVAGAASALVEAYREAMLTKKASAPAPEVDIAPAAGSGPFDFRSERF